MKKLYQVQVEVTYNYKIVVDDENENLVAEDVIDEVMFDNPKGDQIDFSIREIKIRPDLKGGEELYNYDGIIDDLVEEYYQEEEHDEDEEESNKPIKPLEGQGELFE